MLPVRCHYKPHISFSTVWQHWLDIAKLKNVSDQPQQVVMKFPIVSELSTN